MPLNYLNPNHWGKSTLTDNALRLQQIKAENPKQWAAMIEADIQALSMPIKGKSTEFRAVTNGSFLDYLQNEYGSTFEKLSRVQQLCILKLLCINLINSEASLIGFSLADRESWEIIDLLADINQNLPIGEYLSLAEAIINQLKKLPE
ncbi:hypothetical protein [Nostoc sp.]